MKILVTFAVDAEFAPWRRRHDFVPVTVGKLRVFRAQIASVQTYVLLTGVGPSHAASSTMVYLIMQSAQNEEMDACISAGLVGALRPGHSIGKNLAARNIRLSTSDNQENGPELSASDVLLRLAGEQGATQVDRFLTVDHIIQTTKEKVKLSKISEAVEMESFEIFKAAAVWSVPVVAVRSISDMVGEDLPIDLSDAAGPMGKVKALKVLMQVAKRPGAIPRFISFARNSRKAASFLADFLDRYVPALSKSDLFAESLERNSFVT